MRIIEVLADCGHADTLRGIADQNEILECWIDRSEEEERCSMRLLVRVEKQQALLDAIQAAMSGSEGWRILIKPVEAIIPRPPEPEDTEKKSSGTRVREELYQNIEAGGRISSNFIWLVVLSTIVATIGLIEDNVTVVIGAMVIAPLLGPNIALAFGAARGDRVLALASGAAGVLSLTTGLSSALVGVMVAVALLPPTATLGLTLAAGNYHLALGAGLLLLVNIVSVNLAAKLVLIIRGVKPRTWLEKQKARQSMLAYIVFWVVTLLIPVAAMQVYHAFY